MAYLGGFVIDKLELSVLYCTVIPVECPQVNFTQRHVALIVSHRQLAEIAEIFAGMPVKSEQLVRDGSGTPVLTVGSIEGGDARASLSLPGEPSAHSISRYRVLAGDLLLSARSTSLKVAIVPPELDGAVINSTLLGVRSLPRLKPAILAAYMLSGEGQSALEAACQSGSVQMNLTASALSKLEVPVPTPEQQQELAELLIASDAAYQSAVAAAESRRRVVAQLVTDKLR